MDNRRTSTVDGAQSTSREGERPREPPLCDRLPDTVRGAVLGIQPNRNVEWKSMSWTPQARDWITTNQAAASVGTWVECCPENGFRCAEAHRRLGRSLALP